jgi:hypothetical protein
MVMSTYSNGPVCYHKASVSSLRATSLHKHLATGYCCDDEHCHRSHWQKDPQAQDTTDTKVLRLEIDSIRLSPLELETTRQKTILGNLPTEI